MRNTKGTVLSLTLALGAIVLVGAGCASTATPKTDSNADTAVQETNTPAVITTEKQNDAEDDSVAATQRGMYGPYSEEQLALAEEGSVILYFRADWCPSCRTLDADITKNRDDIPADVAILTLDYDTETELKKKYGVTTQHTFVQVDADGNEIKQFGGSVTLADLVSKINR